MSYTQWIEEVQYSESARFDRFDGFRDDDTADQFATGEIVIGRMTNFAGQLVEIVDAFNYDDSVYYVRLDGKRVTECFEDRSRAVTVARWWMSGCPM